MRHLLILIIVLFQLTSYAQLVQDSVNTDIINTDTTTAKEKHEILDDFELRKMEIKGQIYSVLVSDGDTIVIADMDYINITSMRLFTNEFEKGRYFSFKKKSRKVYDYAQEAIQIYKEYEYVKSQHMKKRALKKEIKRLEKELKEKFESKLTHLTKLEGKIMIKMIEKETHKTMYQIIKDIRGTFTAFYWHNFGKLYDYDLKEGYEEGKYPIFDGVINDVNFEKVVINNNKSLKYLKLK